MKLTQIPPEHFDKAPGRCLDDIAAVLEHAHSERDIEHVIAALVAGESQLWVQYSDAGEHIGTAVTRIIDYECLRVCVIEHCFGLSGQAEAYFSSIEEIERWAAYNGCQEVRIIGRKGWRRALADQGYEHRYEVIGKRLNAGGDK